MNTTFLFLVLLCIFLVVGLGINYSNIFSQTVTNMKTFKPTTIPSTKYNSPDDYFLDANATQGVFSNIQFSKPHLEGLTTQNTPIVPKDNDGGTPQGSAYIGATGGIEAFFNRNFIEGLTTGASGASGADAGSSGAYCTTTTYGCCKDGKTVKNSVGNNCVPDESFSDCTKGPYGCCPDEKTLKNYDGSNCIDPSKISCSEWPYGCCADRNIKKNKAGTNCPTSDGTCPTGFVQMWDGSCSPPITNTPNWNYYNHGSHPPNYYHRPYNHPNYYWNKKLTCNNTTYGCCSDGVTIRNSNGSNCSPVNVWKYTGPNVTAYTVNGPNNSGYAVTGPRGNTVYGSTENCASTPYGCCQDGVTMRHADGLNCTSQLTQPNMVGGCEGTRYGCCKDGKTARNADGSNCATYPPAQLTTKTVFIPPPINPYKYHKPKYDHSHESHHTNNSNSNSNNNSNSYNTQPNSNYKPANTDYTLNNASNTTSSLLNATNALLNTPVQPTAQPASTYVSSLLSNATSTAVEKGKPAVCPTPPPCPPCGRCPEPSFECKKVPNYASTNSEFLPMPVLGDFSQFGM